MVSDTGVGIRKEDQTKIFEVKSSDKVDSEIVGLAVAKKLVELMKGKISVQSTLGEGSTFMVELPQKISKMEEPVVEETTPVEPVNEVGFTGKKVLIVDDNKLNIKVAEKALSFLKINSESALSARDALNMVKDNNYDLILMDIMMPEMNGDKCLVKLREEGYKMPVIALTADAVSGSKEKYLSVGFDDYIAKPFTKDEIKEKLEKFFKS